MSGDKTGESTRPDNRIALTPARIDLEPLSCGTGTTVPLAIRNPRDESIDLAISSTLPNVSVVPAHATLAPGDSIEVAVALTAPATPVAATGALVIASGAENLAAPISMSATGVSIVVDPPLLDLASNASTPCSSYAEVFGTSRLGCPWDWSRSSSTLERS